MPRALLISYAGYPYTPSSFLPDNGLAGLAAVLMKEGCDVTILDYGTLSTMRRLVPDEMHKSLKQIYRQFMGLSSGVLGTIAKLRLGARLQRAEKELLLFQAQENSRIGEELAGLVRLEKPDFIGFKLWLGDGFEASIDMARRIKTEFPGIKVFAGGPQADILGTDLFKITDVFDAMVCGDGEISIGGLSKFSTGKGRLIDIPNLVFRDGGKVVATETARVQNLDELPTAVYDHEVYPAMSGDEKVKIIVFDESRGCPFQCHFCYHSDKSGKQWRLKSPRKVIEQMEYYIKRFNIHAFRYAGSSTPAKEIVDVARLLVEKNLDVVYSSFAHVRATDINSFSLMKKSGCYALFFGVESCDDRILKDVMNKHSSAADIKKVLEASIEAGIFTIGSIIFPAPSETKESAQRTFSLLREIYGPNPDSGSVPLQFAGFYPNSEWGRNPEKYGFKLKSPDTYKVDMATYKIKLLFPPRYWKPLPYTIDGKSFSQFAAETESMAKALEESRIITMLPDDVALIGALGGFKPRDYRDITREIFFSGDWRTFAAQIKVINSNITEGASVRRRIREGM